MLVQILVDNPDSWIVPYAHDLAEKIVDCGHDCRLLHKHKDVVAGDILCLLSCERVFKNLSLNKYNLVVHESELPMGKGWSPVSWQVLEGKDEIPVTLFEADEELDAGPIYNTKLIKLNGTELLDEIKHKQGILTAELILKFIIEYPPNTAKKQLGKSSYYPRRGPEDSELNVDESIREQFNLLRVCDNKRYPAFFRIGNEKYIVKIYKEQ